MISAHGSVCAPAAQESATTIRRVEFPDVVADQFIEAYLDEILSLHKVPSTYACEYKFAASDRELAHVARRIVREDVRALELQAPPGVGKTTRFPEYLRRLSTDCVVVLEPTPVLAKVQATAVRAHGNAADYFDSSDLLNYKLAEQSGLVYTTPATFLSYLRLRDLAPERYVGETNRIILLHDECHENDGSTYALRALWSTFKCVARYIKMSATTAGNSVESRQRHNTAQPLVVKKFPPVEEYAIDIRDPPHGTPGAPWSLSAVRNKRTLLFVEDDAVASELARQYGRHVPVGLLRRSHPYEAYERVQRDLAKYSGMVVIADSGYQSGYTFQIDAVIDFGVRYQTMDDGTSRPAMKRRLVTASERRQRVERAGRYKPGVAYIPDETASPADSILGPGEAGQAAAWFVMLGFKPPPELRLVASELLFTANLPKFLASGQTWGLWTREHFTSAAKKKSAQRPAAPASSIPAKSVTWASESALAPTINSTTSPASVAGLAPTVAARDRRPRGSSGELAEELVTSISLLVKPVLQVEVSRGNFLCLISDSYDRGVDYAHSGFAEDLACDHDGEAAMRWLHREVITDSACATGAISAVDKIMRWSVWLATWNYNEAAETISVRRPSDMAGGLVTTTNREGFSTLSGPTATDSGVLRRAEMRTTLIAIYDRLMLHNPKHLYVIDGSYYIRRAVRLEYHRYCILAQAGRSAHHQAVELLQRSRDHIRERRRAQCATVTSSSDLSAGAGVHDEERFVEI